MAHFSILCSNLLSYLDTAGVKGFEPLNAGSKDRRLATWLYPISTPPNEVANRLGDLACCFATPLLLKHILSIGREVYFCYGTT